jgi:hypothetical protein
MKKAKKEKYVSLIVRETRETLLWCTLAFIGLMIMIMVTR